MEAVALFGFIILTLGFLIAAGFCTVYLIMGLRQMAVGKSENSILKKTAGLKTTAVASIILLVMIIVYLKLIFD